MKVCRARGGPESRAGGVGGCLGFGKGYPLLAFGGEMVKGGGGKWFEGCGAVVREVW